MTIIESKTQELIELISNIDSMERGKLSEFYRTQPETKGGKKLKFGPYYKLQIWENGKNITRHIPSSEMPALKQALANYDKFSELVGALEKTIITETRKQHTKTIPPKEVSKKNSTKKSSLKNTEKQKASSPKSEND